MLVSSTRADRARELAKERAKDRSECDLIVYGVSKEVSESDLLQFLEANGSRVASIVIRDGSAMVKCKERRMAVGFFSLWFDNKQTLTLCGRKIFLYAVNQHVKEAVRPFLSHCRRQPLYNRKKPSLPSIDSDVTSVVRTEESESRLVVIPAVVNTVESSTAEIAPVPVLLLESSTNTTVTAEVDVSVTYPETVHAEDEMSRDSFDKALQQRRKEILRKRTGDYMHPDCCIRWSEGDRKKFLSNSSHRLKIKLLESKIKARTRSRTKQLRDRHIRKERVIQAAASKIQEVFREYRQRKTRDNTVVVHPKNSYKYASIYSGIALALIVSAGAVATASFVSTTTAVGLVSVAIAGTAAVGFVSNTKESSTATIVSDLSCRPGWFRLPVQLSSILFWMIIFAIINVAVADGTSPNKNHGTGTIAAAAAAACLAAAASTRPRRAVRDRNPVLYKEDYADDDDDKHGSNKRPSKRKSANPDNDDDNVKMNSTKSLRSSGKEKEVVYEEVDDDEEEDDDEDAPDAFLAPIRRKTSKAKKLTKTDAKLLATELLNDRLEPLNRPNDTNWRNIVQILDDIFEELEPAVKDELVHQLCIQLDIDVDYDKNILMLKRFFADIDHDDGECINNNMSRHTFMILSLVNNAYESKWAKDAKATFAESKEIKRLFDVMKQSMPVGSTPAEVMKAVNKLIFKNAKAGLSNDETITADDDVDMTTNDNETSIFRLPNDETITADDDVDMTTNDNETPKPIRALLRRLYERNVLWSMSGYGKYLTAKKVMVGSFAVCTSVRTAVLTSAHKNGLGSGPNYSMFVKMMVQESLGVDTIFVDLYSGTHPCNAFDKCVPNDQARQEAACAADIVDLGLDVIAFGKLAQKAIHQADEQTKTKTPIKITDAAHPCNSSAYKSKNEGAIGFAKYYDELFRSDVGSFEGFVYWYGLNSDSADFGVGGVLSVNFCKRHLEKVNGEPCENVHINVSSFCLGLGIQNDVQAATYLRENGYGHHPVLSRTLLYIIHISVKGGSCGGVFDYRVVEAQMMLDILLDASVIDEVAIEVAKERLEYAIKLRNITSEGKRKGGSCGGDNDYRVKDAQEAVEKLLDASATDKNAIKAAMLKLENAIELQQKASEGKSKGGKNGGKRSSAEHFNTLTGRILKSESIGGDFDDTLQELIDWKYVGVPKQYGTREGEKTLYNFNQKRRKTYSGFIKTLDNFKAENGEQEQQVAKWSKLFNERLARLETIWKHRKNQTSN